MFGRKNIVIIFAALLFLNSTYVFSYGGEILESKVNALDKKSDKFNIIELKGSGDVCRWAAGRFDPTTGVLEGQYKWKNVSAELLEYPKEYFGYIKHLGIDIDNDGWKEYLVKVTSYLGGTLSALDLLISQFSFILNPPISTKEIFRSSTPLFSVKADGRKNFINELNDLKSRENDVALKRDAFYGYSAYQLQHTLSEVFNYSGKNYIILNNFLNPHLRENDQKIGLVVSINKNKDGEFSNSDICFFSVNRK